MKSTVCTSDFAFSNICHKSQMPSFFQVFITSVSCLTHLRKEDPVGTPSNRDKEERVQPRSASRLPTKLDSPFDIFVHQIFSDFWYHLESWAPPTRAPLGVGDTVPCDTLWQDTCFRSSTKIPRLSTLSNLIIHDKDQLDTPR